MRSTNGLSLMLFFMLLILLPILYLQQLKTPGFKTGLKVVIYSGLEKRLYQTNLEQYLVGVVGAEMPAEFELEALKAQAVAARTLAIRRLKRFGGQGCQHYPGADFCDDFRENQAWLSEAGLKKKWGKNFKNYYQRIYAAVQQTEGIILTYQGRPIDAVFHSTCGGMTANSAEVWNYSLPYLCSVPCQYDQHSHRYSEKIFFNWQELSRKLNISVKKAKKLSVLKRSLSKRVLKVGTGDFCLSGKDFRESLGLNSTMFKLKPVQNGLAITTIGYGHGVGMCQYGADGLAEHGYNYQQILAHYYSGIQFSKIKN